MEILVPCWDLLSGLSRGGRIRGVLIISHRKENPMSAWKNLWCLALILFGLSDALASFTPLRMDVSGERPSIDILTKNPDRIQFEVRLPGVEISRAPLDGKYWDRVEIPGGFHDAEIGTPEVPSLTRLLAIPATARVHAEFEIAESTVIPDVDLIPAQVDDPETLILSTHSVEYNPASYAENDFFPRQSVTVGDPAVMRGVRLVPIRMNPVQYNPVTRELRVIHRFRVTVRFEGEDLRNIPRRSIPLSAAWAKMMETSLINHDDLEVDQTGAGSYLVVCVNDATLLNLIQPLVEWKKRKGHQVVVQTFSAGASTTTIKNIIQSAYNTWEVPPEYVLLIGDTSGSYTLAGWSPSGVDHPYSQLDGSDILADVAVGRLPVENATETTVMVNKVLFYEKMPYVANTDWFHQSVLTAGSGSGTSTIQTNRWIKTRMVWNNFTRIDTMWYTMGGSIPTTITNAINNGVSIFNYRGYWGISGWDNADIDALTNGRKLPFCSVITCGTGGFDGDSNMEHFLSVGTPTTPKGAIGCVGTATLSTNTRCNNTVNVGIYAGFFDEGIYQQGNALNRGKLELYLAYQTNSSSNVNNFSLWNALAGDPGTDIYSGAIRFMSCNVPDNLAWGVNSLSLTITEGAQAVQGAQVCLYKADELQAVGITDAAGQITLPLNVATTGNVKVTITKHNFFPLVDSLDVVQNPVAVGYYSHTVDDDNTGGSSGDNDHIINPGEIVQIPTVFKNYGSSTTATGISTTASTADPYILLSSATQTYPNLAPGATGNSSGSFLLTVSPNCPHGHTIPLNLLTTAAQGSWNGLLNLGVVSYHMIVNSAIASGSDTLLSPGETANLVLYVKNAGAKTATLLTATLVSLDSLVTVNDNTAGFGTVSVGMSANCASNPFNLTASAFAMRGHKADLAVTFSANGATQTDTITLQLGVKTSADPQGPDEYGYYCFDDTDVSYSPVPVYQWIELDPNYGGTGTQLNINDTGEDQDQTIVVSLPFTFRYYGQNTNSIAVCSNGWISTTPDPSYTDFRNYPIPTAIGPTGHIAAFWDDLITWSGGHVFSRYDVTNHRFIIEWSRMKNLGSPQPQETFEILLYDPIYYPTPTGDGEIIFQYNSITEVYGNSDDNGYSTIGIESPSRQDGIQVVYWNTYKDPAAAHVQNGRVYKFTTAFNQAGEPPVIGISPNTLTLNIPEGGYGSQFLTISNSGGSTLTFSTTFSNDLQDASGGPDNFGYRWKDSDELGGPQFAWVDISAIGSTITFPHNDSTSADLPIGFNFPFYGETWSSFIVSANGWLSFTSHSNAYNNTTLPNPAAPPYLLAGFWDDLDPLQSGATVKTWNNGSDSLVVSYLSVPHWGTSIVGTYTFQIILTADGAVTYQYQTLTGNFNDCTIGIQNGSGTDGLQVAYNQTYLHNNMAVKFYHPFLRAVPPSGAVPVNSSTQISVVAYSYGLSQGTYNAQLGIDSNDPVTPHVNVPITINIGSGPVSPVTITLTPINPPIQIPLNGGSFNFNVGVANVSSTSQTFDAWIMVVLPSGSFYGPVLGPVNLTLPVGASISRQRTQNIPGSAPAGNYVYRGYVGTYSTVKWDSSSFNFTKLSTGDGSAPDDWRNTGESFDAWLTTPAPPAQFAFKGCRPNPFNPATEVLFELPEAARVNVRIYDVLGREVALLQDGVLPAGSHILRWNAAQFASGVYFLSFQSGEYRTIQKLMLVK
jgi:hypothetical protein